jgi:hypothetical protein
MSKAINTSILATILLYSASAPCFAQTQPFAYPSRGQSQEQQNQDHAACSAWARQQTGVDPTQLSESTLRASQPSPQGGVVRGAAGGAALNRISFIY